MKRISVPACVVLALGLVVAVGSVTFLGPCVHEDGSFGSCHWAGQALRGIAALALALSLLHLIPAPNQRKIGLDLALMGTALLALCVPGRLIGLCMMADMRCRSVMTPAVTVLSVLLIAVSLADSLTRRKSA